MSPSRQLSSLASSPRSFRRIRVYRCRTQRFALLRETAYSWRRGRATMAARRRFEPTAPIMDPFVVVGSDVSEQLVNLFSMTLIAMRSTFACSPTTRSRLPCLLIDSSISLYDAPCPLARLRFCVQSLISLYSTLPYRIACGTRRGYVAPFFTTFVGQPPLSPTFCSFKLRDVCCLICLDLDLSTVWLIQFRDVHFRTRAPISGKYDTV